MNINGWYDPKFKRINNTSSFLKSRSWIFELLWRSLEINWKWLVKSLDPIMAELCNLPIGLYQCEVFLKILIFINASWHMFQNFCADVLELLAQPKWWCAFISWSVLQAEYVFLWRALFPVASAMTFILSDVNSKFS